MIRLNRTKSLITAGAVTLLTVTGCTVGPNYTRPRVDPPASFRGSDNSAVADRAKDSLGDEQWSTVFHQPELQELIRTALEKNFDLRIAAQRILEQEQQVRITRAQQFPTVSMGATGVAAALPSASGAFSAGTSTTTSPLSLGLSAAWTPDFWGLYRRQTEAARDQLLVQTWAQRAVRLTLVEEVVTTYLELRSLDQQLAIARQTLATRTESVDLTRKLESGGAVPLSDLRQAQELLYAASAAVPAIEQQIQQTENGMQLLLGQQPRPLSHTDPTALAPVPDDLPTGLPSELLERRPDIQQAEGQLKAANAQIGVARAQFFPQISLTASGGTIGNTLAKLFDPDNHAIYGIASLTQPIFAGGRIRGQYELSRRQQEELVLNYQKTINAALRDVSNALIAVQKQRATREQQQYLVAAAQDASRLARLRYEGGAASYLEVLTTDTNLFSAQLGLAGTQESEAATLVQLYSALGGGWK